jgi:DNA-directed RNA polymerase specialized sigma24 family protein
MLEPRSDIRPDGDLAAPSLTEFEDVYLTFSPRLRKIAIVKFRIAPTEAEALVQDVFTTFFMHAKNVEKVEAYLVGAICCRSSSAERHAERNEASQMRWTLP